MSTLPFGLWNPMDRSECRACSVLPMCHGGCPYEALKVPDSPRGACEPYRYHLEPIVEIQHIVGPPPGETPKPSRGGTGGGE